MTATSLFFSERMAVLAKTHANHPALIDRDNPTSFAALHQQALQLAGNMAAIGIKAHDRVAVWLPNCTAWVQTFLACAHLGATVLAVNTRFRSQEVADIIGRGKADWLVFWPDFKGIAFADMLADIPQDVLARLRAETKPLEMAGMQISPEQGQFMRLLVELTGAKRTIEVGTFTGYSVQVSAISAVGEGPKSASQVVP